MQARTIRFPTATVKQAGTLAARRAQETGEEANISDILREAVDIGLDRMQQGLQGPATSVEPPIFLIPLLQVGGISDPQMIRMTCGDRPSDCEITTDTGPFSDFVPLKLVYEPNESNFVRVYVRQLRADGGSDMLPFQPPFSSDDETWDGLDLLSWTRQAPVFEWPGIVRFPVRVHGELRARAVPGVGAGPHEVALRLWLMATFPMYAPRFWKTAAFRT